MQKVDLNTEEMTVKFLRSDIYAKTAWVTAVKVESKQQVNTILSSGKLETTNTAEIGDYIVRNPDGERYVVKPEDFKYEPNGSVKKFVENDKEFYEDVYIPRGRIRAFKNDTGDEVEVDAPWGEIQYGDSDCWFVAQCDNNGDIADNRYIIGGHEFLNTYEKI